MITSATLTSDFTSEFRAAWSMRWVRDTTAPASATLKVAVAKTHDRELLFSLSGISR